MSSQSEQPRRIADELRYELLRDEWELLLSVGTGPTELRTICERTHGDAQDLLRRLELLERYQLVTRDLSGFRLVPAIHERQESMASCLRDLVIHRLELGRELPLASLVRPKLGDMQAVRALIARANEELLPAVFEKASAPADGNSRRYAMFFAVCVDGQPAESDSGVVGPLLQLLRQAATERAITDTKENAKLWIADVHADPEVAESISELFTEFLSSYSTEPATTGTAGFART